MKHSISFILIFASVIQINWSLQITYKCSFAMSNGSHDLLCVNATLADLKVFLETQEPIITRSVTFANSYIHEVSQDTLDATMEFNFKSTIIETFDINALSRINDFTHNYIDNLVSTGIPSRLRSFIDLSNNQINHVSTGVFQSVDKIHLDMSNTQLTDIKPGVFENLSDVRKIILSHNKLTRIQRNTFVNFTQKLTPSYMNREFSSARSIDLSYNQITTLEPYAFYNLANIEKINLQYNNITALNEDVFTNVNVSMLFLGNNQISAISHQAFDNMGSLILLQLNNNNIKTLTSRLFYKLNSLRLLHLADNPIEIIESGAFDGLHALNIDINGNQGFVLGQPHVPNIPANAFNGLSSLSRLDLSNWNITKIAPKAFFEMKLLKVLALNNNQLTDIATGMFYGLAQLDVIDLSFNQLSKLTMDMFEGLNGTQYIGKLEAETKERVITLKELFFTEFEPEKFSLNLLLKNNQIKTIEKDAFTYLANLRMLDLSNNQLTQIAVGTFRGLRFLVKLDLHSNNLTSLEKEVLYPMVRLSDLNVANNQLESLDVRSVIEHSVNDAFKMINLNHNRWKCDNLQFMLMALTENKVDFISASPEYFDSHNVHGIRCVPEKEDEMEHSSLRSESPEMLFINYQKELVNNSKSQITVLIFLCFFYLLTSVLLIALYILRNKTYFNSTLNNLRNNRGDFNQSTVELLSVPQ